MMKRIPLIGISGSIDAEETKQILVRDYMRAVLAAGGIPILLSLDMEGQMLDACMERLDGLLLAGGNDIAPKLFGQLPSQHLGEVNPLRDQFEMWLIGEAIKRQMPTLGICRGMQVMNVALGGTLYQDLPTQYQHVGDTPLHLHMQTCGGRHTSHTVSVSQDSQLFQAVGVNSFDVNSFHHQAVWEVAPTLRVSARAVDGVIEAIEHSTLPFFWAVQWHPERMHQTDRHAAALFAALAEAASEYAANKGKCK